MRSIEIAADVSSASSSELVAAARAICAELAIRPAPGSAVASMELAGQLGAVTDSCEAALSGLVRRVDSSGEMLGQGYSSATAWLVAACGMRHGRARERVIVSRQLERLPSVAGRFRSGELTYGYTATICDAVAHLNDEDCVIAEEALLDLARAGDSAQTVAKAGARIGDIIDTARGVDKSDEDTRRGHRGPWLRISDALDGGSFLKGYADAELRELLRAALGPLAKPQGAHDDRDHAQRTADALKTLLSDGGRNWNATLVINLPAPADRPAQARDAAPAGSTSPAQDQDPADGAPRRDPGGPISARLLDGTPIPAWRARQIALSAGISTLLLGPGGLPLYLGRTTRLATPAQRKTLEVLYPTCATTGCDIPGRLCEADHIPPWHPYGATDIEKLTLTCGFHNRYRVRHPDRVTTTRDDRGRWHITIHQPSRHHSRRQPAGPAP